MSDTNDGCGCLILTAILGVALVCAYPLYDGYVNRTIPVKELEAIKATARLSFSPEKVRLFVEISNSSKWIIGTAGVTVQVKLKNGEKRAFSIAAPDRNDGVMDISPESYGMETGFVLTDAASRLFSSAEVEEWNWSLTKIKGRRPPIRLVKRPIDYIKKLFERDPG